MVLTLLIIAREIFGMKQIVTLCHLENMNKFILATGTMVGYAYAGIFQPQYPGNPYESFAFVTAFWSILWAY